MSLIPKRTRSIPTEGSQIDSPANAGRPRAKKAKLDATKATTMNCTRCGEAGPLTDGMHVACRHVQVVLAFDGGTTQLNARRGSNGKLPCVRCSAEYWSSSELKRHAKKCPKPSHAPSSGCSIGKVSEELDQVERGSYSSMRRSFATAVAGSSSGLVAPVAGSTIKSLNPRIQSSQLPPSGMALHKPLLLDGTRVVNSVPSFSVRPSTQAQPVHRASKQPIAVQVGTPASTAHGVVQHRTSITSASSSMPGASGPSLIPRLKPLRVSTRRSMDHVPYPDVVASSTILSTSQTRLPPDSMDMNDHFLSLGVARGKPRMSGPQGSTEEVSGQPEDRATSAASIAETEVIRMSPSPPFPPPSVKYCPLDFLTEEARYLANLGFCINDEYNVVICIECGGIIDPEKPRKHLMSHHKESKPSPQLDKEFRETVVARHPALTAQPVCPTEPVTPIPRLQAPRSGYKFCTNCRHCFNSPETFRKHCCKGGEAGTQRRHSECWAQRFSPNPAYHWFPVTGPQVAPAPSSSWATYAQEMAQRPKPSSAVSQPTDYRILHQFLAKEGWSQLISGKAHEDLMPLVSYSVKDPEYGSLHRHIHAYLAENQRRIDNYYIRRLIGTRPSAEHHVSYIRHHSDVDYDTHAKYARVVAGMIMLVIRMETEPNDHYAFVVAPEITAACRDLRGVLAAPTEEELQETDAVEEEQSTSELCNELEQDQEEECDETDVHKRAAYKVGETRKIPQSSPEVQEKLTALMLAFYTQLPTATNHGSFFSPVQHYILLSSLRPGLEWSNVTAITQKIAALLFVGRLTISSLMQVHRREAGLGTYHEAYEKVKVYLEEKMEPLMPNLYMLLRGLSGLQSAEQSILLFNAPDSSGTSATFGNRTVTLEQLRVTHLELIDKIELELDELLFHDDRFRIAENVVIQDDPRVLQPGYSFVADSRNHWNHEVTVLQHIVETPQVFAKFGYVDHGGSVRWFPGACSDRMKRIHDLQMMIYVAITLTSGEPPRGTETASHLLANVPGGSIRNAFHLFQVFCLRGSYNKTSVGSGKDKTMVRVPLPKIGRQFVRFLVYLRPLFTEWQYHLHPTMHFNAVHLLYMGLHHPLTSYDFSKSLSKYTTRALGVELRLRVFRQLMSFFTSCNAAVFEAAQTNTSATNAQFGHSAETHTKAYEHDSRMPEGLDLSIFMSTSRVSATFHLLYGHPPQLMEMLEHGKGRIHELVSKIAAMRNRTLISVAAPDHQSATLVVQDLAEAVRRLLIPDIAASHVSLVAQTQAAVVDLFHKPADGAPIAPQVVTCTHPFLLNCLRQFMPKLGSELGFSNVQQAEVTQLMFENKRHVGYFAATGSGKTTPGLLCAKYLDRGRSTVWILPLKVMHEQYGYRCQAHGMSYGSWPLEEHTAPPLHILVTIDRAVGVEDVRPFRKYLTKLIQERRIARIIMDEAHLALTHDEFREVMHHLTFLGQLGVQVVLQTATMPPSLEDGLFTRMGITTWVTCRTKTERGNISYNVIRTSSLKTSVQDEFKKAMGYSRTNRVLVFCLTHRAAEEYAELLGINYIHAGVKDAESALLIQGLRQGSVRALACTSILGVALDVPEMTHVIHVDQPRNVMAFVQETGRLGRDLATRKAWSLVILPTVVNSPVFPVPDRFGQQLLFRSMRDDTVCRRIAIQLFVDGLAEPCSMIPGNTHLCDVCLAQIHHLPGMNHVSTFPADLLTRYLKDEPSHAFPTPRLPLAPRANLEIQMATEHAATKFDVGPQPVAFSDEIKTLHRLVEHFSDRCVGCWARKAIPEHEHRFQDCPWLKDRSSEYKAFTSKLQFQDGTCYRCGLGQHMRYTSQDGQQQYLHAYGKDGEKIFCRYQCATLGLAFVVACDDTAKKCFCESGLWHRASTEDPKHPYTEWIAESDSSRALSNLPSLLLYFSQHFGLPNLNV